MEPWYEYIVTENNRIVPVHSMGWVKHQPEVGSFDAALEKFLFTTGLEDAGLLENEDLGDWVRTIAEFFTAYYLTPEEALYVLKGIMPSWACFRFEWKNEVYFTMRPDFGLLCILKDFGEEPINCYESRIRDELLGVAHQEIEAISRGIKNGEILTDNRGCEPFDQWISFFRKRGFDLSHLTEQYLTNTTYLTPSVSNEIKGSLKRPLNNKNKNIDELIRGIRIEREGDDLLKISFPGRPFKSFTRDSLELGIKTWGELVDLISSDTPLFRTGPLSDQRTYHARRKRMKYINEKLITYFNTRFSLELSRDFKFFEAAKDEGQGVYRLKLRTCVDKTNDEEFKEIPDDLLLSMIKRLQDDLVTQPNNDIIRDRFWDAIRHAMSRGLMAEEDARTKFNEVNKLE